MTANNFNLSSVVDNLTDMFKNNVIDESTVLSALKSVLYTDPYNTSKVLYIDPTASNKNHINSIKSQNLKSNKKRKLQKIDSRNITPENIDIYIESFLRKHPEIIKDYLKKNLRVDWAECKTNYGSRWTLALYDNGEKISQSTLGLNLNI